MAGSGKMGEKEGERGREMVQSPNVFHRERGGGGGGAKTITSAPPHPPGSHLYANRVGDGQGLHISISLSQNAAAENSSSRSACQRSPRQLSPASVWEHLGNECGPLCPDARSSMSLMSDATAPPPLRAPPHNLANETADSQV